jgi:hypothetical protein
VGILPLTVVTHWVTTSSFNELCPNPNDLDLSRHEHELLDIVRRETRE